MNLEYKKIAAQIFNYQVWVSETDPTVLKTTFEKHLQDAQFSILAFNEHHFPTQGYTCFWLLGESHLAIHTFPEEQRSYIELSSCNEEKLIVFKTLNKQEND